MSGKGQGGQKQAVRVTVFVAREELISDVYQVSGSIEANEQVQLYPETQGLVRKIYFEEGTRVSKGALLLKLNDADLQAQLKKALATRKLKEDNARRNAFLLEKEAVSQADADLSLTELNSMDADIELLKEQIRKTEIRAPFNGIIGLRSISEGAFITTATFISTLMDDAKLKINFALPEKYASLVKTGDRIQFKISGVEEVFHAKIYAMDPAVSDQTRTIRMRAICEGKDARIVPGLFANISLFPSQNKPSILIPTASIVPVLKGQRVYVVHGDTVAEVTVKTGFRTEDRIQVTEGLKPGDSVVVNGILYMKKGIKVNVAKSTS